MPYSFTVRAPHKAGAKIKVAEELAKVVASQPIHEADRVHAQDAAEAFIDLLGDESEDKDVVVSVNGTISTNTAEGVTNASVSVSAYFGIKLAQ